MKIKRSFKDISLKRGTSVTCNEETFATVARQTRMGQHEKGACSTANCTHCPEVALKQLKSGAVVESFFSKFELAK